MTPAKSSGDTNDWKNKARSFLVRSRQELWGKHSDDVMAWLFTHGFRNNFIQDMLLGWNKYPKSRPIDPWGLAGHPHDPLIQNGKLTLPPGLVIPYIVNKDLRKLIFFNHQPDVYPQCFTLPGSSLEPIIWGTQASRLVVTLNIMHGLYVHQELQQHVTVIIPHDPLAPDKKTLEMIRQAQAYRIYADSPDTRPWGSGIDPSRWFSNVSPEDMVRQMSSLPPNHD